jgi:hypothetical protein
MAGTSPAMTMNVIAIRQHTDDYAQCTGNKAQRSTPCQSGVLVKLPRQ